MMREQVFLIGLRYPHHAHHSGYEAFGRYIGTAMRTAREFPLDPGEMGVAAEPGHLQDGSASLVFPGRAPDGMVLPPAHDPQQGPRVPRALWRLGSLAAATGQSAHREPAGGLLSSTRGPFEEIGIHRADSEASRRRYPGMRSPAWHTSRSFFRPIASSSSARGRHRILPSYRSSKAPAGLRHRRFAPAGFRNASGGDPSRLEGESGGALPLDRHAQRQEIVFPATG